MPNWRGTALVVGAACVAVGALAHTCGRRADPLEVVRAEESLVIAGHFEEPGRDPISLEARCRQTSYSLRPLTLVTGLGPDGSFAFTGLSDTDYTIEIAVRDNPVRVLAQRTFVRAGCETLFLSPDPALLQVPQPLAD